MVGVGKEVHTFPKEINTNVKVCAQVELELVNYDITVQ